MNFIQFHLGDWAAATCHLSLLEDAVYGRMVRRYYTTEMPLPADHAEVCRVVGARSKAERNAVDTVLMEYFELQEDGYHQPRCDREIAAYLEVQSASDEVKRAEQERMRRHRQERSELYAVLRGHGVTLPYNAPMQRVRELARQYGGRPLNVLPATPHATDMQRACNAAATANPIPNTQLPIPNTEGETHTTVVAPAKSGGVCPEGEGNAVSSLESWASASAGQGDELGSPPATAPATQPATVAGVHGLPADPMPTPTAAGRVCKLMRQMGVADTNPGHPTLLGLIKSGISDEQFSWAATSAVEKKKGFVYALGMLKGALNDAQALPVSQLAAVKPPTQAEINNFRAAPSLFKGAAGDRIRKYLEERKHDAIAIAG